MTTVPRLVSELEQEGVSFWEETGLLRFRAPQGVMTESRRPAMSSIGTKRAAISNSSSPEAGTPKFFRK